MDVGERYEDDGDLDLGAREYVVHKFDEFGVSEAVFGIRGRDPAEGKVYGFYRALYDII